MLLTLIRHGEVNGRVHVLRGRNDEALSETGAQQLCEIAEIIQPDVMTVVSSPLQRCIAFARAFSDQRQLPLHIIDDLREIDFGDWENLTLAEAQARDPECFHAFQHDTENWQPPNGERYSLFRHRVQQALQQIIKLNASHVLAITHGGVIRALLADCLQLSPASAARIGIPLAGLCHLWIDEQGLGSLLRLHWLGSSCAH